ncbi:hypothetical protein DVH24_034891 [Malus domestica]|uniref:Uncharacterized protein n=1 Tax=Malus domestica TaxID=3750 RepID=A0A498IE59_MALDO|nr:hypothetical protein DVH24_034891 [Malus domestica]
MYKDPTSGQLICQKHPNQIPTPWQYFKYCIMFLVLEDETNEINALIIGKLGEKVFGAPYKDLVFNQRSADQKQLPSKFLRLIGQRKKFHLRFGTRRNLLNSNDFLIYNVYEDTAIPPTTPQSTSREIAVSSTTVSSSTTPPETSRESHKGKRGEPFLHDWIFAPATTCGHNFLVWTKDLTCFLYEPSSSKLKNIQLDIELKLIPVFTTIS